MVVVLVRAEEQVLINYKYTLKCQVVSSNVRSVCREEQSNTSFPCRLLPQLTHSTYFVRSFVVCIRDVILLKPQLYSFCSVNGTDDDYGVRLPSRM